MLWEAIKLANQSVRRNVLRSILTLLGIVIGVSAVIAMVTIGNGTTQKVTEDLSKLGSNMLVARPGRDTFGAGGSGADVRSFTERGDPAERACQCARDCANSYAVCTGCLWGGELRHYGDGHGIGFLCRAGLDF
jgi:hypothetical protein